MFRTPNNYAKSKSFYKNDVKPVFDCRLLLGLRGWARKEMCDSHLYYEDCDVMRALAGLNS